MKTLKLKDHKYAQCKVQIDEIDGLTRITLISYVTPVIIAIGQSELTSMFHLRCTGTYSRTTISHIRFFLKEYFDDLCYYDMKEIAGKKDEYKVGTLSKKLALI